MRIDHNALSLAEAVAQAQKTGASSGNSRTNGQSASGDRVQISNLAANLTTDPARISELQTAYRSGTYRVSSMQLAGSLIHYAFGN